MDVLIVDDEPLARHRIEDLLAGEADMRVVGTCANGYEALEAMCQQSPDLVFLDVQMPGLDGFEVLQRVSEMPLIIFVTAYDHYALKAFEVHALDYLLKPFDAGRFRQALARVRQQVNRERSGQVMQLLRSLNRQYLERLIVRSSQRIRLVEVESVWWIEAAGNYVQIHTADGDMHTLRETMKNLEARLNPDQFLRIHRSLIVNIAAIKELQPWASGEYIVLLKDSTRLNSSRGYRDQVRALLNNTIQTG